MTPGSGVMSLVKFVGGEMVECVNRSDIVRITTDVYKKRSGEVMLSATVYVRDCSEPIEMSLINTDQNSKNIRHLTDIMERSEVADPVTIFIEQFSKYIAA